MNRRDLFSLLGGAAMLPVATRAQQPGMPVIGYLSTRTQASDASFMTAFLQGLREGDYIENKNVAIEFYYSGGRYDQLAGMVAQLVRRGVNVIVATGSQSGLAAKAGTKAIPIVFTVASDPVEIGLVTSLSRPGGNLTGAANLNVQVGPKLLEFLHELLPAATVVGLLVNPANSASGMDYGRAELANLQSAARNLGLQLHILNASNEGDLGPAFAAMAQVRADALMINPDPFFTSRSSLLAALALRHGLPAFYQFRQFATVGGLASYGGSSTDQYRLAGLYTARILKGEKPADLPVQQSIKVELVINLKTAKALGLAVPPALLIRADEVIE